jgi:hypothetical protein
MTPRMKMQVLTIIAYFLEINSARKPEYKVPVHAPNSRIDVSQPFLVELVVYSPMWLPKAVIVLFDNSVSINREKLLSARCKCCQESRRIDLQNPREDTLIVSIQEPTDTGEACDTKYTSILKQRLWASLRRPCLQSDVYCR